jgi:hypothetical protein
LVIFIPSTILFYYYFIFKILYDNIEHYYYFLFILSTFSITVIIFNSKIKLW